MFLVVACSTTSADKAEEKDPAAEEFYQLGKKRKRDLKRVKVSAVREEHENLR